MKVRLTIAVFAYFCLTTSWATVPKSLDLRPQPALRLAPASDTPLIFDLPITYNSQVKHWIAYFQGNGRGVFKNWLERSSRYMNHFQSILRKQGLPQDLAYMAMIESGFVNHATSSAQAVGPWQFIKETGQRYGLTVSWWIDERRDFDKSTKAAAKYLHELYQMFGAWYLVAASYNAGENRIRKLATQHQTRNFWLIAQKGGFADETENYVPKLIAAMLIAKAPNLYGFRELKFQAPLEFDHFRVPGGTRMDSLAVELGVSTRQMRDLNPELILGYIPPQVSGHLIRIPKGSISRVSNFVRRQLVSSND